MTHCETPARPAHEILVKNKALWDLFTFQGERVQNDAHRHIRGPALPPPCLDPFISDYLVANGLPVDYPEGNAFAVCLTHDVDDIYPPLHHTALSALYSAGRLDPGELVGHLFWKARGIDHSPYMNFKPIMDLEEAYGARSSFYFLATDRDVRRFRYRVEDLEGRIGEIVDRGFDVGLHGGYYSYDDPAAIVGEKRRLEKVLNKKVVGYRNHYLRFKVPETWAHLVEAGFRYDATIGNNRVIGFKNGLCHPFKPFDARVGRTLDIVELPLVLADFTLLTGNLPAGRVWEIARTLIDRVERSHGVVTVLWHNDVFGAGFRKDWGRLYEKILDYCRVKKAWMASGKDLSEWVRRAV